jgi:hypothetical protein
MTQMSGRSFDGACMAWQPQRDGIPSSPSGAIKERGRTQDEAVGTGSGKARFTAVVMAAQARRPAGPQARSPAAPQVGTE